MEASETSRFESLVDLTKSQIQVALDHFHKPCVLWSGGKDSMVLLHLIMQVSGPLDVICWREPWFPWKQQFCNRIIQEWRLNVFDYAPSRVELAEGNGRIDVMNYYQTGPHSNPEFLGLARGTESPESGHPWLCAVDTFLNRPTGSFDFRWDLMFHGHKSCDVDPLTGKMPLNTDMMVRPGAASAIFPLRGWTDADVFRYIKQFEIPFDPDRYVYENGEWKILSDKRNNPDYYHTCFNCVDRRNDKYVPCPKLGLHVNNISDRVAYKNPVADYANLRTEK